MKKLVLILICAVIMTVFIAFNYLLWDKEQSTKSLGSRDATIDELDRQIRSLNDINNQLNAKIQVLENNDKEFQKKYDDLKLREQQGYNEVSLKNEILYRLKQQMDVKPFEDVIKKWVGSINEGKYEIAYLLQKSQTNNDSEQLTSFINKYKGIKSIEAKSIQQYIGTATDKNKGDIIFSVDLVVKRVENADKPTFDEGENLRFFNLIFDAEKNGWVISDITAAS